MYLSRLEIYGFKTFAQKVDLKFDEGITNIVGPNGCGKTNVVDALRWTLGEQKTTVLRTEKMDNVIFAGTKTRKPLNVAEVSITVQNTKNILPVEYTEVKVTRRIYRNGDSEYYLNGLPCRLKDINDLFMDTGMGADAYSVIELKMVEQILSDNTEDRRRMFEEAAGITKYKLRRRQTLKKLESTRIDLTRANDIITEIEKNVNSLKRQTQKAKRYQKLMNQLKYEDVRLAWHDYEKLKMQLEPLQTKLSGLEDEAEKLLGDITRKEAESEALQTALIAKEQTLRQEQEQLEALTQEIETVEKQIIVNRERKRSQEDLIRRYTDEKITFQQRQEMLRGRIEELVLQNKALEQTIQTVQAAYEMQKNDTDQHEQKLAAERQSIESVRAALVRHIDELARRRNQYQVTKNNIQNIERKIRELEQDIQSQQNQSGDALSLLDEQQAEYRQLLQKSDDLKKQLADIETRVESLRHDTEKIRHEKAESENELKLLHAQRVILMKAIESHEGFPDSVRYLLDQKTSGLNATVADMFSVDETYKQAAEAALGDSFSHVVADSAHQIREALRQLGEGNRGQATFINLPQLPDQPCPAEQADFGPVQTAILARGIDAVRSDHPLLVRWLLGDVVFVRDFDTALRLAEDYPAIRFISLHGEIAKGRYLVKGGSRSQSSASIVGQRESLTRLETRIRETEERLVKSTDALTQNEQARDQAEAERNQIQNLLKTSETRIHELDKIIAQSQYEHRRSADFVQKNEDILIQAKTELETMREQLAQIEPEITALEEQRTQQEAELHRLEQQIREMEIQLKTKSELSSKTAADLYKTESDIKNNLNTINTFRMQITEAEETIARHESESAAAKEEIERIQQQTMELDRTLVELSRRQDQQTRERDLLEQDVHDQREMNLQCETALRKIRRQREEMLNSRHTLEQQTGNLKYDMRALAERILRDYDFDLLKDTLDILQPEPAADTRDEDEADMDKNGTAVPPASGEDSAGEKTIDEVLDENLTDGHLETQGYDPEAAKKTIDELRRKLKMLGMVNMEAFAEYEKEKERLDVLVQQRADLLEAEKQLMETIQTINTTAQKQFMEVFERIRLNFIKVFTTLFANSEANLELGAGEDPLEASIEIIARPVGKKNQHIASLSQGEKTLTAIALLFAIYLVKPSPFCILDEVDAPLDDANIDKFTKILKDFSKDTQFIVVTHNKRTMEMASNIFGITMQEAGVSKVVSVKFSDRETQSDDIEDIIRKNQVADLTTEIKEPPGPSPVNG